ncbi:MAG: AAA family ATPase [Planctomycetota bacterium]
MTDTQQPIVYVIAGPNGAGKTTFANEYLPRYALCNEFVNADLIAAGLSPFNPETQAIASGRLMLARINELTLQRSNFAFETTLAGRGHAKRLQAMKDDHGYTIAFVFIWLPSVEQAIARVATRVTQGGHDIPEPTIRRRYKQGIRNFGSVYRPIMDEFLVYDGSTSPAARVVSEEEGMRRIFDEERYEELLNRTPELLS